LRIVEGYVFYPSTAGYHPRRCGRYDSDEDHSPTPEPPGTRVFSLEIRAAAFPQRFRQPTTIVKYNGETDPRVWLNDYRLACQLGGATSDEVIIRNLPLHLADSAQTWLEHLPASQIHNWDDLVCTFVGNFQRTYVRPGNSWDLRSCTQKPGESLRDFILRFSKRCTELPSVAQSEIVHAFLEGTTCRDLVRELGEARRTTRTNCSTSPPALPQVKRLWERSSMARRANARTTRPRRAANPRSPTGRTSGARRGRSRTARRASRDATPTMARPWLLTRLDGALDRPLEVRGFSTTC
jgi:hypothetical protein